MTTQSGFDATMDALREELVEEFLSSRLFLYAEEIAKEWETICFQYGLRLPRPAFSISQSRSTLGHWDPVAQTLSISQYAIEELSWDSVVGVLKHEMAHALVTKWGREHESDHGETFKKACDRLGLLEPFRSSRVTLDNLHELSRREASPQSSLHRRIERLEALAQAADGHEAELAIERLRSLRRQARDLFPGDGRRPEDFGIKTISLARKRLSREESIAASLLARHFGVEVIHSDEFHAQRLERTKTVVLLGRKPLLEMAEFIFHFLLDEAKRSWELYKRDAGRSARDRSSFQSGVLLGFDSALRRGASAGVRGTLRSGVAPQTASEAVIPRDERQALNSFVSSQFPRLSRRSTSRSGFSASAHEAGKAVGRKIVMPDPVKGAGCSHTKALPPSSRAAQ